MNVLEDYFASLYAFCGGMQQPVDPVVAAAFNDFVHAFAWLCPSFVEAENEWGQPICVAFDACPFEPVATIHEWIAPESFQGDALVQKYLVHGVPKEEWGHRLWRLLHHSVDRFSPDEIYTVLQHCQLLLPCPQCRAHLRQTLQLFTPAKCKKSAQYLSDVHNIVNKRIGKPVVGKMTPYAQQVCDIINRGHV